MSASRKVSRGKIHLESPHYRVYKNQPHILYVEKEAVAALPNILVRDTSATLDAKKYVPYKYRYKFTAEDNDCLQFAEGLAKGVVTYKGDACVYKVHGPYKTQRKFGVTDKKNVELARKYRKDAAANPKKGQAYAIVRTNLLKALKEGEEDLPPYHIAHVIIEDGDWRVTLEADAGNEDLTRPDFGIYSIKEPSMSFHEKYKKVYGEEAAATIVLEKSDD
jgi:hypothetical protein